MLTKKLSLSLCILTWEVNSNDLYPFGMSFVRNKDEEAMFGAGSYVNYKYNGKELQETGMYDYGWRQYMPDTERWYGMDQLSEMYHSLSPYHYVANNPVNFVDPDGNIYVTVLITSFPNLYLCRNLKYVCLLSYF